MRTRRGSSGFPWIFVSFVSLFQQVMLARGARYNKNRAFGTTMARPERSNRNAMSGGERVMDTRTFLKSAAGLAATGPVPPHTYAPRHPGQVKITGVHWPTARRTGD